MFSAKHNLFPPQLPVSTRLNLKNSKLRHYPFMAPIHSRMPAILERDAWPAWLGQNVGDLVAPLRPAAEDVLWAVPVSVAVNSVQDNEAELLAVERKI
jgi:putative SOS response-associated peptidase YedK